MIDNNFFILLIVMSVIIIGIVFLREKNNVIIFLTEFLILVSIVYFIPSNFLILYMFFELSMFPILVMILGFGSQVEKINSSYYLMFYAAFCSFPFLYVYFNRMFFLNFLYYDFFISWEIFLILSLSFIMKFPVYFFHLWLPKAHVEAPTTARMLLAGLLLKLGTIGFFRILGSFNYLNGVFWFYLSFIGIILCSFFCIFQSDSKSLAAYSSVTHMGFLLLSIIFLSISGKSSSFFLILAHGYTSTLIFFFIGEFFHVVGRRSVYFINGLLFSSIFVVIFLGFVFLSNSGVPPSLSFFSEFIVVTNSFRFMFYTLFFLFFYFIFSFYYSLYYITNVFIGKCFYFIGNWRRGFSYFISYIIYNVFWMRVFF